MSELLNPGFSKPANSSVKVAPCNTQQKWLRTKRKAVSDFSLYPLTPQWPWYRADIQVAVMLGGKQKELFSCGWKHISFPFQFCPSAPCLTLCSLLWIHWLSSGLARAQDWTGMWVKIRKMRQKLSRWLGWLKYFLSAHIKVERNNQPHKVVFWPLHISAPFTHIIYMHSKWMNEYIKKSRINKWFQKWLDH